jgi:hypothetical protein
MKKDVQMPHERIVGGRVLSSESVLFRGRIVFAAAVMGAASFAEAANQNSIGGLKEPERLVETSGYLSEDIGRALIAVARGVVDRGSTLKEKY